MSFYVFQQIPQYFSFPCVSQIRTCRQTMRAVSAALPWVRCSRLPFKHWLPNLRLKSGMTQRTNSFQLGMLNTWTSCAISLKQFASHRRPRIIGLLTGNENQRHTISVPVLESVGSSSNSIWPPLLDLISKLK
ncbi:uncharacterized protein BDW47DRAFT_102790 [Aspergillus candidus]|uniref:Uncharacterized protein n=1 Tax=Aspergillus candidus TaxID=41067 RepID=A0A2I2FG60_ASPCN|nr:hypothetical protein BDW47DRAFT_102790 [Aspergillus candidus]PLB39608.1 hypothetical protein BDW47DRAFT_102790 [Aspergillus candidus]